MKIVLAIFDLVWPWYQLLWKADAKSFILIYDLQTLLQFWNLTQNDPKFVIWPQTQNFLSGKDSQVLLIILSYFSRKLIESVIFN